MALVTLCAFLYAFQPTQFYYGDACTNLLVLRAITNYHSLDLHPVSQLCSGSAKRMFSLGAHGEWYSVHEIGWVLLAYPLYALFGDKGALLLNIAAIGLALGCMFLISKRAAKYDSSLLSVLVVAVTPPVLHAPASMGNDWPGAAILSVVMYLLWIGRCRAAGFLFGALSLVRIQSILAFPALLALIWLRKSDTPKPGENPSKLRSTTRFFACACISCATFFAQNYFLYGNATTFSYQRSLDDLTNPNTLVRHTDLFSWPTRGKASQLLLGPEGGVLFSQRYFAAVWLLALPLLWRRLRAVAGFFVIGLFTYIAVYSSWYELHQPVRYFAIFYLLTVIPLSLLFDWLSQKIGIKSV